ncbi:class I SAM-dependent methyltransferase [Streptomyces sp. NRRL S-350]|uniref:class I SAM-dependent methyltransferase n=1 Tax=Streptomyces sp. NRRL S-350 TaxID=1463902 RepID=UPI0004C29B70|nr:class I SAM-dependent methyltransferase [Streptomyces sp. NRRL S-350]
MTTPAHNEPKGLFTSTAADYARHRPGIPPEAVSLLADTMRDADCPALLDLGSGTGQVPAALLPAVPRIDRVDLVDPDQDMLRQAADTLEPLLGGRPAGFHPVAAEDFTPPSDSYRADLITCARSFHWMDRAAVLKMADRVTTPEATVAFMGDGSLWTYRADWTSALKQLIQSYLGEERRAGTGGVYAGPGQRYEDDLAASPFSQVTERRFPVRRVWTPAKVVGYLRSTSFARPDLFGGRHDRFEAEALELLERYSERGGLVEDAVFTVLLARRPGGKA